MKSTSRLSLMLLCVMSAWLIATGPCGNTVAAETKKLTSEKPFFEVWDEEMIFCHLEVAMDGTVLLFEPVRFKDKPGHIIVKRSEDGGKTWGPEIRVGEAVKIDGDMSDDGRYKGAHVGWSELGTTVVDENTGDIIVFATSFKPADILYRSKDHGKTWKTEKTVFKPDVNGWLSSPDSSCDQGVTLRYGKKKGRLVVPTQVWVGSIDGDKRTYLNKGQGRKYFCTRYTVILHSDDGGKTWIPSAPFPLGGASEPTLAELTDGSIHFVSRSHCRPGNKLIATSYDCGETLVNAHEDDELFDGPPDVYGCKSAMIRLPYDDRDILIFSSPSPKIPKRHDITVWVSFDGGKTWPVSRLVKKGPGNYTWLAAGRKGTPSEGMIYLAANKDWIARFNLAWILEKQELPKNIKVKK